MISETLKRVLQEEAQAIASLAERSDPNLEQAVQWFLECKGRVITCGLGKSGHVARKTAATLASTGTAA
ncbi:hypothetical protein ABTM58_19440, partial [Acinetobacter baumannii]